jgi:hypothetical protein
MQAAPRYDRAWIMGFAHEKRRASKGQKPFVGCLKEAWATAKEIVDGEDMRAESARAVVLSTTQLIYRSPIGATVSAAMEGKKGTDVVTLPRSSRNAGCEVPISRPPQGSKAILQGGQVDLLKRTSGSLQRF